eukprot:1194795-Prorocentrum_minimum.AAC.1
MDRDPRYNRLVDGEHEGPVIFLPIRAPKEMTHAGGKDGAVEGVEVEDHVLGVLQVTIQPKITCARNCPRRGVFKTHVYASQPVRARRLCRTLRYTLSATPAVLHFSTATRLVIPSPNPRQTQADETGEDDF